MTRLKWFRSRDDVIGDLNAKVSRLKAELVVAGRNLSAANDRVATRSRRIGELTDELARYKELAAVRLGRVEALELQCGALEHENSALEAEVAGIAELKAEVAAARKQGI